MRLDTIYAIVRVNRVDTSSRIGIRSDSSELDHYIRKDKQETLYTRLLRYVGQPFSRTAALFCVYSSLSSFEQLDNL